MSEHNHTHTHVDENGHVYEHSHGHHHSHAQTKAVLNRLSRAQGHLDAVRKMVERGEDCTEVLVQLAAVISALNSTGRVILKDHIAHCIVDAVESGDREAVDSLNQAIERVLKLKVIDLKTDPQLMGALGAAEYARQKGMAR